MQARTHTKTLYVKHHLNEVAFYVRASRKVFVCVRASPVVKIDEACPVLEQSPVLELSFSTEQSFSTGLDYGSSARSVSSISTTGQALTEASMGVHPYVPRVCAW